jgi:hypothetical protein
MNNVILILVLLDIQRAQQGSVVTDQMIMNTRRTLVIVLNYCNL